MSPSDLALTLPKHCPSRPPGARRTLTDMHFLAWRCLCWQRLCSFSEKKKTKTQAFFLRYCSKVPQEYSAPNCCAFMGKACGLNPGRSGLRLQTRFLTVERMPRVPATGRTRRLCARPCQASRAEPVGGQAFSPPLPVCMCQSVSSWHREQHTL